MSDLTSNLSAELRNPAYNDESDGHVRLRAADEIDRLTERLAGAYASVNLLTEMLEAKAPQEATGGLDVAKLNRDLCDQEGHVLGLPHRECLRCHTKFAPESAPLEPAPDYQATLYALLVRRGYAQHEAHSLAFDDVLTLTEVAINQGPRLAEGVGSNPDVPGHDRQPHEPLPAPCSECERLRAGLSLIATDEHRLMNITARMTAESILSGKPIGAPLTKGGAR